MKKKKIVFEVVVVIFGLLTLLAATGAVHDLFYFVSTAVVCLLFGLYYVIYIKTREENDLWKIYPLFALLLGAAFMFAKPTYMTPDEPIHLYKTYSISNELMGIDNGSSIKMRSDDYLAQEIGIVSTMQYEEVNKIREAYNKNYYAISDFFCNNEELIDLGREPLQYDSYMYIIPAIGLTIGRVLSLGTVPTYMLGTVFNVFLFIVLFSASIYITPVAKEVFFTIGLMPIVFQQCVSFSCDAFLIPVGAFTIALYYCILNKIEKNEATVKELILWFVTMMLIVPAKRFLCFPLLVFPLVLLYKSRNIRLKRIIIIGFIFTVAIICVYSYIHFQGKDFVAAPFSPEMTFSITYILTHPLEIIKMLINTITFRGTDYLMGFLGTNPGWMNFRIPTFLSVSYVLVIFIVLICNDNFFSNKLRIVVDCVFIALMAVIFAGMLLGWTSKENIVIEGVQGRYLVIPLLLLLSNINIKNIKCDSNIMYKMRYALPMLDIFYIIYIYAYVGGGF